MAAGYLTRPDINSFGPSMTLFSLCLRKCLIEVSNQVVYIFDTDA